MHFSPSYRALSFVVFLALLFAARADAATYDVIACGQGTENKNGSWRYETNSMSTFEQGSSCPTSATISGIWGKPNSGAFQGLYARPALLSVPVTGEWAQWSFHAPIGLSISRLSIRRWLGMEGGSGWRLYGRTAEGVLDGETCVVFPGNYECNIGGPLASSIVRGVRTRTVSYGFICQGAGGCTGGGTIHDARAAVYWARVTIADDTRPNVNASASFGGEAANGYGRGQLTTLVSASDASGISQLRAYLDGELRGSVSRSCDYTRTKPCTDVTSPEPVSVDTTQLPDGSYQLELAAVDAAGNEGRSERRTIRVDNHPPAAPAGLRALGAGPEFRLSWNVPSDAGAPLSAVRYKLCPVGGGSCTSEQRLARPVSDSLLVQVPGRGQWRAYVWLEDELGHQSALNAASIDLAYPAPVATPPSGAPAPGAPAAIPPVATPPAPTGKAAAPASPVRKASAGLRITSAQVSGAALKVRGRLDRRASGSVVVSYLPAERGEFRRRPVTTQAKIRHGRFTATLRLARTSGGRARVTVVVGYGGNSRFSRARVQRQLGRS